MLAMISNPQHDMFEIEVTDASDVVLRLLVHASTPVPLDAEVSCSHPWKIEGSLTGPFCKDTHTLPATIPLRETAGSPGLHAEVVVPDPCFWSAETPYLYRLRIEFSRGGKPFSHEEQLIGLQPSGATVNNP